MFYASMRNVLLLLTIAALGWLPTETWAQTDQPTIEHPQRAGQTHEHVPHPNAGKISISSGFKTTNAYYFRGIFQENQGFIIQPWLDATAQLPDDMSLTFGIWNSFHDTQTAATVNGTGPDSWYEADLYLALSKKLSDKLTGGLIYTAYTSPNDAFTTIHEFALKLSCDDTECWKDTAITSGLQPYVLLAFEADGSALGPDEGVYLELGVKPSWTLIEGEDHPVTLSVPVTVGLSLTDYYGAPNSSNPTKNDPNFGYFDIGVELTMALTCVPADYGTWTASLGLHYLFLSENTELANNGDDSEFIFSFGISMGY